MRRCVWLAIILLAAGTARAAEPPPAGRGQDHPLTGRIWDVAGTQFISMETLVDRLVTARFVLLGERHDNTDHHSFQAWIVRGLIGAGRRPAIAFEMLGTDQAIALDAHLARAPRDAAGLGDAVGWSASGWPPWKDYQPIAEAALATGLPIVAANLPVATARAVARGNVDAVDAGLARAYGLDRPAASDLQAAMEAEMRDSHCGRLPDRALRAMVRAQRARDAQMAERLVAGQRDGAVLIAGTGHVRTDRGVPTYLAMRAPGTAVASVAFVEVAADRTALADYAERFGGRRLPFDYVWFTVRADDVDPCTRFRE